MNVKQIYIFGAVLLALVLGVAVKQFQKPGNIATQELGPLEIAIDPEIVAKMEIVPPAEGKDVILVKDEGNWKVESFFNARAKADKIDRFMETLNEASGELRSKDSELFSDFGIGENEGYRVNFFDSAGGELTSLYLGTKRPDGRTIFVREADSEAVYLTDANLYNRMGIYSEIKEDTIPKQDFWTLNKLGEFKGDQVNKILARRFRDGRESVTAELVREPLPDDPSKNKWRVVQPATSFAPDVETVKKFFNDLNTWNATKVLDPEGEGYGLEAPQFQLTLTTADGEETEIKVGGPYDASKKKFFVKVSSSPIVHQFSEYYFKQLNIDASKFFGKNPWGVDPEKIESLRMKAEKKEYAFQPMEKKSSSVTGYLKKLKDLKAERLLFDPAEKKKVRASGKHWIEVVKEGGISETLDVGELLPGDAKQYAAQMRDGSQPFAITEALFKKFFEGLDSLSEE